MATINLRLFDCTITVTGTSIENYRPSSGERITVEVGTETTITLKYDKYMAPAVLPVLKYTVPYSTTVLHSEDFTPSSGREYVLTTDFSACNQYANAVLSITSQGIETYASVVINAINCSCNYQSGDYLSTETTFVITCTPDYEFQIEPSVTASDRYSSNSRFLTKVNDTTYQITFTPNTGFDYTFTASAIKKSIVIDKYGLITVYRLTKDELKTVATSRWIQRHYEPVTVNNTVVLYNAKDEYIDTAKFVTTLIKIYAHLESDSKARLMFGPYDMGIDCDVIGTDTMTLDCGTVRITGLYGNSIDYESTEIDAYLPFVGFVSLKPTDYMGKDVHLYYQVNVLNGEALAVLCADNQVIATHSCNVGFSVPYHLGSGEFISHSLSPNTNYLLDEPPFIYTKTHIAVNPDPTLPYHDTKFYAILGTLSGYTEATEIDFNNLSAHITKTEIDEIKTLLANGVFL